MMFTKGQKLRIKPSRYREYAQINGKVWAEDMNSGVIVIDMPYPEVVAIVCPVANTRHKLTAKYFEVVRQKTLNDLVIK